MSLYQNVTFRGWTLTKTGPFINLESVSGQNNYYWTGTEIGLQTWNAYTFNFSDGFCGQRNDGKEVEPPAASEQVKPEKPPVPKEGETENKAQARVEAHQAPLQKISVKEKSAVVEVRAGDTFFRIVMRNYGRYDKVVESKVLAANPEITDPSQIKVQQRITLPALPPLAAAPEP